MQKAAGTNGCTAPCDMDRADLFHCAIVGWSTPLLKCGMTTLPPYRTISWLPQRGIQEMLCRFERSVSGVEKSTHFCDILCQIGAKIPLLAYASVGMTGLFEVATWRDGMTS